MLTQAHIEYDGDLNLTPSPFRYFILNTCNDIVGYFKYFLHVSNITFSLSRIRFSWITKIKFSFFAVK